ncbi:MAG: hypothetical protein O7G85_13235 [Planctomycetota bacterium]|nr:hypothetical protein [Planctomycetota bacterium]
MSQDTPIWMRKLLRLLATILVVDVGFLCVVAIAALMRVSSWFESEVLIGSLVLTALYTVIALVAVAYMIKGSRVRQMLWAVALVSLCLGFSILLFLFGDDLEYKLGYETIEFFQKMIFSISLLAITLVFDGGIRTFETRNQSIRSLRRFYVLAGWAFLVLVEILVWFGETIFRAFRNADEYALMLLILLFSVCASGPMTLRIIRRQEQTKFAKEDATLETTFTIEMDCPKCGESLRQPTGAGRCASCGFTMLIEVEEPRCECGYLIYEHTSELCPECGSSISSDDRLCVPELANST